MYVMIFCVCNKSFDYLRKYFNMLNIKIYKRMTKNIMYGMILILRLCLCIFYLTCLSIFQDSRHFYYQHKNHIFGALYFNGKYFIK